MKLSVIIPLYNNEHFILEALESVKSQDIDDMELIVVDDGSTDNSKAIVESFSEDNSFVRVISQENQGVSAARNAGLNAANGEYVGFLDSDDIYRPNALFSMLTVAEYWNADVVIGESRSVRTFSTIRLARSRALSRKTIINRDDQCFIYNFSICNKIFKRSLLEENNIRFQPIKHAEDGLFLFSVLNVAKTITGCPQYVYEYRKRLVIDAQSALQSLDQSMLDSAVTAAKSIAELTKDYPLDFQNEYNKRILRVTLINEYYRRLWTLDDGAFNCLVDHINNYRAKLNQSDWEEINDISEDLEIIDHIKTKGEIEKKPLVSVVLPYGLSKNEVNSLIRTLYYQLCPNFEVMADGRYKDMIPNEFKSMLNFHLCDNSADEWDSLVRQSKGRFVQICAEPCIYAENTLQMMIRRLQNSEKDFISVHPKNYRDGQATLIPEFKMIFPMPKNASSEAYSAATQIDSIWSNKLFAKDALIKVFEMLNNSDDVSKKGMTIAYNNLSYARFAKDYIGIQGYSNDFPNGVNTALFLPSTKRQKSSSIINRLQKKVYAFARLLPINKKKVLFISDIRGEIGGNYLPLYKPLKDAGYNVICDFKKNKNYNEGRKRKLQRAVDYATAGFIVLEDFHSDTTWLRMRKGQKLVQLWHAAGAFKKFAWSRAKGTENISISTGYRKITDAIVSAEGIRHNYAEAYDIDVKYIHATGLPRTDTLFNSDYISEVRKRYDEKYPVLKGKKVLLVSPTYRGTKLSKATYGFDKLDPERMHKVLGDDYVIVFKWHPATWSVLQKKKKSAYDYKDYSPYTIDLSAERDINDLLIIADLVVTDYSSIIFEYELLNKPIIYYWYDVNEYMIDRGMYYPLEEYVYGSVVYTFDQLLEALSNPDPGTDKRDLFHKKFMESCDGNSTERVLNQIFSVT